MVKLIILLLFIQFTANIIYPFQTAKAQDNQTCEDYLEQADDAYYEGEFSTSLQLIHTCLKQPDISNEFRSRAYVILTRTFLAMEKPDKAKEYISKILELNPDYLPTIEEETPKYVNTVLLVRKEKEGQEAVKEETGISSWLWIGAGGVVATAAIIAIASSGEEKKVEKDKPLPEPPEFP